MAMSAQAPTSQARAFPQVGDTFSSLNEFKLACHRAARASRSLRGLRDMLTLSHAVVAGTELRILTGSETSAGMSCRVNEGATEQKLPVGAVCSFRIDASALRDGSGRVKVRASTLEHSCPSKVREARAQNGLAKAWTKRKIEQFAKYIAEGVSGVKKRGGRKRRHDEPTTSSESDEEEEEQADEDEAETGAAPPSTMPAQKRYPSAQDVAQEVSKLVNVRSSASHEDEELKRFPVAQAGPVTFPSSRQSFPTSRDLLVRLYAYGKSRGFTIYRKSGSSEKRHLRLVCAKSHNRYRNTKQGQCKMLVTANEGADGTWHVATSKLTHNHEIDDSDDEGTSTPRPLKRQAIIAASSSPESRRQQANESTRRLTTVESVSVLSASTPLRLDEIAALLYSIFPAVFAHELELIVTLITHLGISTFDDLVALLRLEPILVQQLVCAVKMPSLGPVEEESMRTALGICVLSFRQQATNELHE